MVVVAFARSIYLGDSHRLWRRIRLRFPGALMGYIAYIRQIYLDADHYKLVKDAYAKDPRGMERPQYDRALEGVIDSKRILLPANRVVEMDRMLRLAADLKQPVILYGMRRSVPPEAAPVLKKSGAPVLLSLKWPEAPRDPDPEADQTLRSLENIDQGPAAAAMLKKAGVPFAFYTDGIDAPRDLNRAVRRLSTRDFRGKTPCAHLLCRRPKSTAWPTGWAVSRKVRSPTWC